MRLLLAIRAFFKCLFDRQAAGRIQIALQADLSTTPAATKPAAGESQPPNPKTKKTPAPKPARSDALTLLEALQREARLIDIVKEPLAQYSDEQIGAAAREVLRDCGGVLDRFFGLQPVVEGEEGSSVELPGTAVPGRIRVIGSPPPAASHGQLVHHGWMATRCQLPTWSGTDEHRLVVAPAEVEVR